MRKIFQNREIFCYKKKTLNSMISNSINVPADIYLLKSTIEALAKGMKYVQS